MKELFVMITLALGVAIGFVACGDDDDKTDTVVDAGVVATDAGVVATDAGVDADAGAAGAAGAAGSAGAGGSAGAAGSEAE